MNVRNALNQWFWQDMGKDTGKDTQGSPALSYSFIPFYSDLLNQTCQRHVHMCFVEIFVLNYKILNLTLFYKKKYKFNL